MSNGISAFERFSKLFFQIGKLVMEGDRDAEQVADVLQVVLVKKDFHAILISPPPPVINLIPADGWAAEWTRFYREVFGREVDFAGVEIPAEQFGFGWVVVIAQGFALNEVWAKCKEGFYAYSYLGDDLDAVVPTNDCTSVVAYARRFRDCVEADVENRNLSANRLAERKTQNITLLERLVLELWYHWRTGDHLDVKNNTLCAGSRVSGGGVPSVCWCDGGLCVGCSRPNGANDRLRARSAV